MESEKTDRKTKQGTSERANEKAELSEGCWNRESEVDKENAYKQSEKEAKKQTRSKAKRRRKERNHIKTSTRSSCQRAIGPLDETALVTWLRVFEESKKCA